MAVIESSTKTMCKSLGNPQHFQILSFNVKGLKTKLDHPRKRVYREQACYKNKDIVIEKLKFLIIICYKELQFLYENVANCVWKISWYFI